MTVSLTKIANSKTAIADTLLNEQTVKCSFLGSSYCSEIFRAALGFYWRLAEPFFFFSAHRCRNPHRTGSTSSHDWSGFAL